MATLDVFVGSWDDISEHTEMLADRQVRVIVLPKSAESSSTETRLPQEETERLLEELSDIGTDSPSWPEECCTRETVDTDEDSD